MNVTGASSKMSTQSSKPRYNLRSKRKGLDSGEASGRPMKKSKVYPDLVNEQNRNGLGAAGLNYDDESVADNDRPEPSKRSGVHGKQPKSKKPKPSRLYISNLAQGTTKDQLKNHFGNRLSVVTIRVNLASNSEPDSALCIFPGSKPEAQKAVNQLDGSILNGSRISVKITSKKAYRHAMALEQAAASGELENAAPSQKNQDSASYGTNGIKSYGANIGETQVQSHKQTDVNPPNLNKGKPCKLRIDNVGGGISKDDLKELFQDFRVLSVSIAVDKTTNKRLGWAFVNVDSLATAIQAIGALDGTVLDGNHGNALHIHIMDEKLAAAFGNGQQFDDAEPSNGSSQMHSPGGWYRLKISNLSATTSKKDLMALFTRFEIFHIVIPCDRKGMVSREGLVSMKSAAAAQKAIDSLTGSLVKGKSVVVGPAEHETRIRPASSLFWHDVKQEAQSPYEVNEEPEGELSRKRRRVSDGNSFTPINAVSEQYDDNASMLAQNNHRSGDLFHIPVRFTPGATACSYQSLEEHSATFLEGLPNDDIPGTSMDTDQIQRSEFYSDPSVGSPPKKDAHNYQDFQERLASPMADSHNYGALARAASSNTFTSYEAPTPSVKLRDLSPDGQILQHRYFHIVDPSSAVHCLSCGAPGHAEDTCPQAQCRHCGVTGEHFAFSCPTFQKCVRCRQRGHKMNECASAAPNRHPLAARGAAIDPCDICGLIGHLEEECAALWRTSYSDTNNVRRIEASEMTLCCYHCGSNQHWGDDCPNSSADLRRMRQQGGPSVWSAAFASMFIEGRDNPTWVIRGKREQPIGKIRGVRAVPDGSAKPQGGYNYQLALLNDMMG